MNNDAPTLTPGRFGRVEMILIDDPGRFILRLLLATLVLSRYLASGYMMESADSAHGDMSRRSTYMMLTISSCHK